MTDNLQNICGYNNFIENLYGENITLSIMYNYLHKNDLDKTKCVINKTNVRNKERKKEIAAK